MSEYLCPITKGKCPRPGEVADGFEHLSTDGYCGGRIEIEEPICPVAESTLREEIKKLKNNGIPETAMVIRRMDEYLVTIQNSRTGKHLAGIWSGDSI